MHNHNHIRQKMQSHRKKKKSFPGKKNLSFYLSTYIIQPRLHGFELGCALTFASAAKFEIEAKISFSLEAKKTLISHDSLRCETPKIWSENEGKISEK